MAKPRKRPDSSPVPHLRRTAAVVTQTAAVFLKACLRETFPDFEGSGHNRPKVSALKKRTCHPVCCALRGEVAFPAYGEDKPEILPSMLLGFICVKVAPTLAGRTLKGSMLYPQPSAQSAFGRSFRQAVLAATVLSGT